MSVNTREFVPMAAPSSTATTDFIPTKTTFNKESSIFLPGQGSVPGSGSAPPTYNQDLGKGFTFNKELNQTQEPANQMKMSVGSMAFVPNK